ncbi:T-cell receptor alpha chain V region HPB-MLT [Sciurus carolinensis]|nr:T-cell receptor alpha chain V region HPB-MLT [Sciurus carolinensis]
MVLFRLLQLVMASMWLGSSFAQKVAQAQPAVWVQEKEAVSLHCTYDTSATSYGLLWYKQPSSGEMVFLIRQDSYSKENATQGRYSLSLQTASKSIQLVIPWGTPVYFCALRGDTEGGLLEAVVQNPRVCLRHPPGVGTKAGNGHPREDVARAVAARVWG